MTRKEKWEAFHQEVERLQHPDAVPAFIQEITPGLWSVQKLMRRRPPIHGMIHQMFNDPPRAQDFEPFYNGWPGDHRGWMRFESKESARDFYKFCEGLISFDEYRAIPKPPLSYAQVDLDDRGDFVDQQTGKDA